MTRVGSQRHIKKKMHLVGYCHSHKLMFTTYVLLMSVLSLAFQLIMPVSLEVLYVFGPLTPTAVLYYIYIHGLPSVL